MSAVLQHSIGRQVVDCHVNVRGVDPHSLQERIGRLCREALPGVLEAALDRHAPAGTVLRIDALTVDLGRIGLAGLETELAERLRVRLAESLRQIWHAAPAPGRSLAFATALRTALEGGGAISRLLTQFDAGFRRALLARVRDGAHDRLDEAVAAFRHVVPAATAAELEGALAIAALRCALDGTSMAPVHLAVSALAHEPARSPVRAVLRAFLARHGAAYRRIVRDSGHAAGIRPDDESRASNVDVIDPHPDQATGLAVEQAGVVLLHPFLPRLFTALGFVNGAALTQPDRALAMLHFLCTGVRQAPEAALALAKVLCAQPLTAPVDGTVVLSDAECAEGLAMLAAAIGHWAVLRNTSADGLRGAFLLRPGVLRERDGDWQLRVQADTADILLDSLPWGVNAVRLPWMRTILWVEWR